MAEPLPRKIMADMIKKLYVQTARRNGDQMDLNLTVGVYIENLSEYPADVVYHVLKQWPKQSKWWPTWYELAEMLEFWVTPRRVLLEALQTE